MDSTSLGLMSEIEPSYGMPSTMYRGALLALIEPIPRMRIVAPPDAGSPDDEIICTPGAVPARALVTFVTTLASMASAPTMEAEPVNELLVAVPYATTIVSSRNSESGCSSTSMIPLEATVTSALL